jgi:Tol biopolymer transport system component
MIAFTGTFACPFEEAAVGVIRRNGTGRRMVTACHYALEGFTWAPDGNSLLYSGSRQIRLVDVGTAEERVIRRGGAPSFAPSGGRFAYLRGLERRDIRRARIDGGASRLLRKRERLRSPLLWSPRGQTIAYYYHAGGGTWLISARTGDRLRRVTGRRLRPLDWSPDGRRLLCLGGRPRGFYIVRADGKGPPRRLALAPREYEIDAAWSPDGRRIAVLVAVLVRPRFHRYTIRTMSTSGARKRRVWRTPMIYDYEESPRDVPLSVAWQPVPPRD